MLILSEAPLKRDVAESSIFAGLSEVGRIPLAGIPPPMIIVAYLLQLASLNFTNAAQLLPNIAAHGKGSSNAC